MKKREDELANPQDHFRHNEPRPMDEKMASQLHMRLHRKTMSNQSSAFNLDKGASLFGPMGHHFVDDCAPATPPTGNILREKAARTGK